MTTIEPFIKLAELFESKGHHLYLVGGSARDYLLERDFVEFDCATDATPSEMKVIIPNANYTFEKFGNAIYKENGLRFEITVFRVEDEYIDYRHPASIKFVKEMKQDYVRRDFTINALYIDKNLHIHDYCDGRKDLELKVIRMIGDCNKRLVEDPLRIFRALRFSLALGFSIDTELEKAIYKNANIIDNLNPEKISLEVKKMYNISPSGTSKLLAKYHIR